jgi:preprotein translocase subunit YajC
VIGEVFVSIWRPTTALVVAFCLFIVQTLTAATPFDPTAIKKQADQLGPGAKIRLRLITGPELVGFMDAIHDDGLLISGKMIETPKLITYEQMARLTPATRRYTAHGAVDPVAARRVVIALGVGQHIVVNRAGAKAIHGNIQAIEADRFTVLPDHQTTSVTIAYSDIRHVEKNLSLGATVVLIVLIAAAVVVAASVAATR